MTVMCRAITGTAGAAALVDYSKLEPQDSQLGWHRSLPIGAIRKTHLQYEVRSGQATSVPAVANMA